MMTRTRSTSPGAIRRPPSGNASRRLCGAAGLALKPSTPPQSALKKRLAAPQQQEPRRPAPKEPCIAASILLDVDAYIPIEVRSLGGDLIADGKFHHCETVKAVQDEVCAAPEEPHFTHQLFWEGLILQPDCLLKDLNVPLSGATFHLIARTGPSEEELKVIADAQKVLADGYEYIDGLLGQAGHFGWIFRSGDLAVKLACQATMHLLASHARSIDVRRDGIPKDDSWVSIEKMVLDPYFLEHLLHLPAIIERGKLSAKQVRSCLACIQDINGGTRVEKINNVLGAGDAGHFTAASVLGYVCAMCDYFAKISTVLPQLGADGLQEILDPHDFPARHGLLTAFQRLPRGQKCTQDALVKSLLHQGEHERRTAIRA